MTGRVQRYRQIADRFEDAIRENIGQFIGIAELCRIAGVERRTLARAFQEVHGTTPTRYLRAARLSLAREALLVPGAECKTVTEIATRYGFRELGRFATEYRAAFGENPSETMRRAAPDVCRERSIARLQADRRE
jgi:AraC family ethanolamine operon transcriptional activator